MKRCNMCGSQLPDSSNFCSDCGSSNLIVEQYNSTIQKKGNFGWAVLGFFVPIAGLVLYLVWKNENPGDAKMAGMGALVSAILEAIFVIIYIMFFIYMIMRVGY